MSDILLSRSDSARPALPPLRIHHILIWTAVMAVMFAVLSQTGLFDSSQTLWAITIVIVGHVLCSAGLTCLGLGAVWRWRGLQFPSEPGHALVIITGLATILSELIYLLFAAFFKNGDGAATAYYGMANGASNWALWLFRWSGPIACVMFAAISSVSAIWIARGWRWRLVFALIAAMMIVEAVVKGFFSLLVRTIDSANFVELSLWTNVSTDAIPTAILLLCMALAVMEDRRLAIKYHWSHWAGVGMYWIDGAFKLVKYVVWYLLIGGT